MDRGIADSGSKATKSFSVYITEPAETDLPLREDSLTFCIQMENINKARRGKEVISGLDGSNMLYVETTKEAPPNPNKALSNPTKAPLNPSEAMSSRNIVELTSLNEPGTEMDMRPIFFFCPNYTETLVSFKLSTEQILRATLYRDYLLRPV